MMSVLQQLFRCCDASLYADERPGHGEIIMLHYKPVPVIKEGAAL